MGRRFPQPRNMHLLLGAQDGCTGHIMTSGGLKSDNGKEKSCEDVRDSLVAWLLLLKGA